MRRPWSACSLIPNRPGYQVVLLLKSNEVVADVVVVEGGQHRLAKHAVTAVVGWAPSNGDRAP